MGSDKKCICSVKSGMMNRSEPTLGYSSRGAVFSSLCKRREGQGSRDCLLKHKDGPFLLRLENMKHWAFSCLAMLRDQTILSREENGGSIMDLGAGENSEHVPDFLADFQRPSSSQFLPFRD